MATVSGEYEFHLPYLLDGRVATTFRARCRYAVTLNGARRRGAHEPIGGMTPARLLDLHDIEIDVSGAHLGGAATAPAWVAPDRHLAGRATEYLSLPEVRASIVATAQERVPLRAVS